MAEKLITPGQLRQYATNIDGIRNSFNTLMKDVQNTMQNMKREYESEAATAFINEFNKLQVNITAYAKVMQDYSLYLNDTARKFDEADKRIETNTTSISNASLFS